MQHEVKRADAVPGIIAPPELVYRPRLDLPAHSGNQDVAGQLEAGFHDRAYGLDVGGNCALHVVGSGAIDPFILDDVGLRLEATTCEDGLLAAVGGVEMAVEKELEAVAGPAQLAEGVVTALADFLQTRVNCTTRSRSMFASTRPLSLSLTAILSLPVNRCLKAIRRAGVRATRDFRC